MVKSTAKLAALALSGALAAACAEPASQARPEFVRKGEPAPGLALSGLINSPLKEFQSLEELAGKVIVLDFWATWCEPCVENIPRFNALAEKFRGKSVVFIAVTDEAGGDVSGFLRRTPIKGWVAPGAPAAVFRAYRVYARPHTVLIGRDSRVAAVTSPVMVTEEMITALLSGRTPSAPDLPGRAADGKK